MLECCVRLGGGQLVFETIKDMLIVEKGQDLDWSTQPESKYPTSNRPFEQQDSTFIAHLGDAHVDRTSYRGRYAIQEGFYEQLKSFARCEVPASY